jgi:hypothetical protein
MMSVKRRPRAQTSVRNPQAGGAAPRRTKIKFKNFANVTTNTWKLHHYGRGDLPSALRGVTTEREARASGVWG